jgi:hypothetical protein
MELRLSAQDETFADTIGKVGFEPIPEVRHCGRKRRELAAMRRSRLPGFSPTASKIFCSSTALALCSIIGSVPEGESESLRAAYELIANWSRVRLE